MDIARPARYAHICLVRRRLLSRMLLYVSLTKTNAEAAAQSLF